jgi:hypothetical protein
VAQDAHGAFSRYLAADKPAAACHRHYSHPLFAGTWCHLTEERRSCRRRADGVYYLCDEARGHMLSNESLG